MPLFPPFTTQRLRLRPDILRTSLTHVLLAGRLPSEHARPERGGVPVAGLLPALHPDGVQTRLRLLPSLLLLVLVNQPQRSRGPLSALLRPFAPEGWRA